MGLRNIRKTRLNLKWRLKEAKKARQMQSFASDTSTPQIHRSAANDPEPAYRQRSSGKSYE